MLRSTEPSANNRRYIGKSHILAAIDRFHAAHPGIVLELNVTRYPYSFIGADRSGRSALAGAAGKKRGVAGDQPSQTWHDALLGYMGGSVAARARAEASMAAQGARAGVYFVLPGKPAANRTLN